MGASFFAILLGDIGTTKVASQKKIWIATKLVVRFVKIMI